MPAVLIVWLLSLLLGLQPITTDLYLPALPVLRGELGASMAQAQLTLTALLLAFGVSQLVWGPLSDRFGRKPILLVGLAAYTLASVAGALADSIDALIVWRAIQGAAMGAAVMCARAIVRDLYAPLQGARVMSQGLSGLGVIAFLSAPTGGVLTDLLNWRWALLALSLFGAATLALVALRFHETVAQPNPQALQGGTLWRTWRRILSHRTFWAFSLLSACSYAGLFTFLAASSFVFTGMLGLSKTQYGAVMAANSLAYIAGTFVCRAGLAGFLTLAGGIGLVWVSLAEWISVASLMLPQTLFMIGHGIHQPCGQSGAVGPFPQAAGAASALNGFLMMVSAFAMGSWLGAHLGNSVLPMTLGIGFWSVLIALCAWTLVQRQG